MQETDTKPEVLNRATNKWRVTAKVLPPKTLEIEGHVKGGENIACWLSNDNNTWYDMHHREIDPPKKWRYLLHKE